MSDATDLSEVPPLEMAGRWNRQFQFLRDLHETLKAKDGRIEQLEKRIHAQSVFGSSLLRQREELERERDQARHHAESLRAKVMADEIWPAKADFLFPWETNDE